MNDNYLNLTPTLRVGRRGSTGRVSVLRARGSEFEPRRRQLFSFFSFFFSLRHFVLGSSNSLRTFIFRSTVQYNQNEPQHHHSRWRPSIESRVRSLSRVAFFFLFLVSFTLPLLSVVRGVPFGPLFFRATRNSLLTSPTLKSKMAGETRACSVPFGPANKPKTLVRPFVQSEESIPAVGASDRTRIGYPSGDSPMTF